MKHYKPPSVILKGKHGNKRGKIQLQGHAQDIQSRRNARIDPFYLSAPQRAFTVHEVNNKPTTDLC